MGRHSSKHLIVGPFPDADPIDTILLFLRTNGYRIVTREDGSPPEALEVQQTQPEALEPEALEPEAPEPEASEPDEPDEPDAPEPDAPEPDEPDAPEPDAPEPPTDICLRVEVERGEPGRGWFSSNLTELHTKLVVELDGNRVLLDYDIDTTGQRLTDDERDFWKREARTIEEYVLGEITVKNLVAEEKARASELRRDFVMRGLWIGGIVGIVLFLFLVSILTR